MLRHVKTLQKSVVKIEGARPTHLKNQVDAVPIDFLCDLAIQTQKKLIQDKLNNIRDIF